MACSFQRVRDKLILMRIYINNDWQFNREFDEAMTSPAYVGPCETVRIPHSVVTTPFNYFDESIYQMVSGYRKVFTPDDSWKDKAVLLTFDAVAHEATVFLNGRKLGSHSNGYTAFTYDISESLIFGEENVLAVQVDSRESLNIPPFGFVIDYMTYGGIYRDVYIDIKNKTYISDIYVHPSLSIKDGRAEEVLVNSDITITGKNADTGSFTVRQTLTDRQTGNKQTFQPDQKRPESETASEAIQRIETSFQVSDISLWSPDSPNMYDLETEILLGGEVIDSVSTATAFRRSEFRADGYYLNGSKFKFRGLNRHQSYPYVGYAMPKSMQEMDAVVLKKELGLNAVRTSHYPQSHYFLNKCDEIGLLVFTEIPGWQHIGDEEWKNQACKNVEEMILQYRNHPSIMLWGVRINESKDDDDFYTRTNEIAHRLDPYRQTGGVRCDTKMNLLEDVYTFNDFIHEGDNPGCRPKSKVTPNVNKPYFVTEYNGHMYPTKSYDWEEHRREHLIRHANVLDAIAGESDICGSFGWCMADYNTHKDFGAGDRICYHGVLDMFRNPKMAAAIYKMQQEEEIFLDITSSMDIGEHPGCVAGKTYILSNADSVKMYKNGRFIKEYKKSDSDYKNLAAGPIVIDDMIGDAIEKTGRYKPSQARDIKICLNEAAFYGMGGLTIKGKLAGLRCMLLHGMKMSDMVDIYNEHVNNWGGESTVYRFEAIVGGKVVKTLVKEPATSIHLSAVADHTRLTDGDTYDVAAIRLLMKDQNENILPYYQEVVEIRTQGDIEIIGDKVISLKGGMGAVYVKTTGRDVQIEISVDSIKGITVIAK